MVWCLEFLEQKLSSKEIDRRYHTLRKWAVKRYPKSGCFDLKWFSGLLQQIDRLWYHRRLLKELTRVYGGLTLSMDVDEERIAGYVQESADGRHIALHMNRNLFASLFGQQEYGYHSGGLLCENKLDCFLHVLLHESLHLLLTLCDRDGHRKDTQHHGGTFMRVLRNQFGQVDPQHGLLPGYNQYDDLKTIKKHLRRGQLVEIFFKGSWQKGKITRIGRKWVDVLCAKTSKTYVVNAGLIRFPHRRKKRSTVLTHR